MYLYHAHAVALGGIVERPAPQIIPALASCSLALSGGTSSAKQSNFDNGLVAFDSAESHITGSPETRNGATVHVTGVTISINGLNIRNMVMADQVCLRLASEHKEPSQSSSAPPPGQQSPPWGEPSIITTGCYFDNLRIAGHVATLQYGHDFFHKYDTYAKLQDGFTNDNGKGELTKYLVGSQVKLPQNAPQHLSEICDAFDKQQKNLPKLNRAVLCSFVQTVTGINGSEIDNWGPIIRIPQFGTLYLGEVISCLGHRRVNMFRLQLGSPDVAGLVGGGGGSNGDGFP